VFSESITNHFLRSRHYLKSPKAKKPVLIALCQINTVTGHMRLNSEAILRALDQAQSQGAELAVFPEMALTGYPPRDLLDFPDFLREVNQWGDRLELEAKQRGILALIGQPLINPFEGKKPLINAAVLYGTGQDQRPYVAKKLLPTYDVFDEHRYFEPAPEDSKLGLLEIPSRSGQRIKLGVTICEDFWNDREFWRSERLYPVDPVEQLIQWGADILINLSASPFVINKPEVRLNMIRHTACRWGRPVVMVNQIGGNDQVVFDGGSVAVTSSGLPVTKICWFQESVTVADFGNEGSSDRDLGGETASAPGVIESVESALRLGLRDYLTKTGFQRVLIGNSGGIDSAVVLSLCALELGPDQVLSLSMPGPYTSEETRADSRNLAHNWGIRHLEIPVTPGFETMKSVFQAMGDEGPGQLFADLNRAPSKLADENLQSRLRGLSLMWLSNALTDQPTLVVTTGNKSELATGYCTLYGDMCGGLALISDLPKMMVYALARHINEKSGTKIPVTIIDREPSAELAPGQKDSDSLPPYPVLDEIVRLHVEEHQGSLEIVGKGVAEETVVRRVLRLIAINEYKRQQAAPGIKVTSKAFGMGRRIPIARGPFG
jgi:NAD+ synthetase